MDFERTVLDASAFYAGVPFGSTSGVTYMTTSEVYEEISHIKKSHGALDALIAMGRLQITEPVAEYVDAARKISERTGDAQNLSRQDISVIALCMETGLGIVTDDYSVSNVVCSAGLSVTPVMTRGIRDVRRWQYYCPGCGTVMAMTVAGTKVRRQGHGQVRSAPTATATAARLQCASCGTELKRRPIKRSMTKRQDGSAHL